MTIRRASEIAVILAVLAFAPNASADAAALKQQADEAYDARRYDDAARAYEASWNEKHDPSVLYNLARTYEALARHPEALERLQRFAESAPFEVRKKVPRLDGMLAVYRTRVATLEVTANVAGARVIVRNTIVGETTDGTATIKVNAGTAIIEVAKDGYRSWRKEMTFEGAASTDVHAKLEKKSLTSQEDLEASPSPRAPLQPAAPASADSPLYTQWWFWAGTGALVAVASVLVVVAVTTERDAPPGSLGTVSGPLVTW